MVGNLAPVPVLPLGGTSQHHHQPHHIPQNSSSDGGGHRVGLPQQQQQQQQQQHLTQGSGTTATAPYVVVRVVGRSLEEEEGSPHQVAVIATGWVLFHHLHLPPHLMPYRN